MKGSHNCDNDRKGFCTVCAEPVYATAEKLKERDQLKAEVERLKRDWHRDLTQAILPELKAAKETIGAENAALRKRVEELEAVAKESVHPLGGRAVVLFCGECGAPYADWSKSYRTDCYGCWIERARRESAEEMFQRVVDWIDRDFCLIHRGSSQSATSRRGLETFMRNALPLDPPKAQEEKPHEYRRSGALKLACLVCGKPEADHQ